MDCHCSISWTTDAPYIGLCPEKKNGTKTDIMATGKEKSVIPEILTNDFSGQITVYLLKGEMEDIPPLSIKLFGIKSRSISFAWIKEQCGISCQLRDAEKVWFCGGKDHTLCFKNCGNATIFKGSSILARNKKYSLYYGEKILLIFNNGEFELELHYKNMKPSER